MQVVDCTGEVLLVEPPPPPPEVDDPGRPADWMLLGLLVALFVFEMWALWKHKNTISQRVQHVSRTRWWMRWLVGVLGVGLVVWHLFWGFPW